MRDVYLPAINVSLMSKKGYIPSDLIMIVYEKKEYLRKFRSPIKT